MQHIGYRTRRNKRRNHISRPTKTNAGSTLKSGLVTTVPPTYIRECRILPRFGEERSRTMMSEVHSKLSSARSRRATMLCGREGKVNKEPDNQGLSKYLSRRLTDSALLPSTYNVLSEPGISKTTPSKSAPRLGAEMDTLFAYGRAERP